MKLLATAALAALVLVQLGGCARTASQTTTTAGSSSQITGTGVLPPNQVSPCCRALAEHRISLDQCMENPTCKANNRVCCMQAIQ